MPNGGGSSVSSGDRAGLDNGRAADRAASHRRAERRAAYARRMASTPRLRGMALAEVAEGMHVRHLRVPPPDVVFVKGIIEASEGLGALFAEAGGELAIAVPRGREADLARLLEDLAGEIDLHVEVAPDA
jgi:hypothetical protein